MRFTLKSALMLAVILLLVGATTSYAQLTGPVTFTAASSNPQVRAQGITEVVGDQLITATNAASTLTTGVAGGTATLSVTYNGAITNAATSPTVACAALPLGATATLTEGSSGISVTFDNLTAAAAATITPCWNVSGNTLNITFALVGGATLTTGNGATPMTILIHGVRVNASAATGTVTASVTSAPSNVLFLAGFFNPMTVATIAPGLDTTKTQVVSSSSTSFNVTSGANAVTKVATSFNNCTLQTVPSTLTGQPVTTLAAPIGIQAVEGFVGAFTTAAQEAAKSGSEATIGTRIQIDISGVSSQASLAALGQVNNVAGTLQAELLSTAGTLETGTSTLDVRAGSTVTFTYEITTAAAAAGTPSTLQIPIWVFSTSGALADTSTMGVTIHMAPISTVTTQSSTAGILRFVDAPITGSASINACITALLYPFVTNKLGFDTGIAVSNMGQDNKGTSSQSGSCTLTFWDGTTTGKTPTATATLGPLAAGQSATTLVSTAAAGFQGYAIAKCNFQFAHGFAIVVNGFGGTAAPTVGSVYLAIVNNDSRSGTVVAGVESVGE